MRRAGVVLALLAACSNKPGLEKKIPDVVKAGETAACRADTSALKTAEEAVFANTGAYSNVAGLVSAHLLSVESPLHDVAVSGAHYAVIVKDARCGTIGHTVGQTAADN